jgi:hypothetical protein
MIRSKNNLKVVTKTMQGPKELDGFDDEILVLLQELRDGCIGDGQLKDKNQPFNVQRADPQRRG